MGRRQFSIRLVALFLAGLVSLYHSLGAQEPAPQRSASQSPSTPPTSCQANTSDDPLAVRIRKLEAINQSIIDRLDQSERERRRSEERYRSLEEKYENLRKRLEQNPEQATHAALPSDESSKVDRGGGAGDEGRTIVGKAGHSHGYADLMTCPEPEEWPLRAAFGDGFTFTSPDDEYQLRVRVLDQTDFKDFIPNNQVPATSGLYIPRARVYFEGQLTKLFEYQVSIQRSVDGVWDLLDGNVNVLADPRFQVRFGRMLVPYSYDWYDHLEQFFITPERALFPLNFGLSRSAGLEVHGKLFDERLEYAVGGYDGHLIGPADNNSTIDAVGYVNFQPFVQSEQFPLLRNFNVGVSGFLGEQISPQAPLPLRTSLQSSENDAAAQQATSIFLQYNSDVYTVGGRSATALHMAWYVGGLSFEAEWQGGRDHYERAGQAFQVSVPVSGNHFTASYFITGETITGRGMVSPLRPFDPGRNEWGPGAIELFARYSGLSLGQTVFTAGLANPQDWTRNLGMTDIGFNWYLTRYLKIYVDWQHSMYGSPVLLNPSTGTHSRENDLFWIRGQLYY